MYFVIENDIYYFEYLAGFIRDFIDIVDLHSLGNFVCIQVIFLYKASIDENSCISEVNQSIYSKKFRDVSGF